MEDNTKNTPMTRMLEFIIKKRMAALAAQPIEAEKVKVKNTPKKEKTAG